MSSIVQVSIPQGILKMIFESARVLHPKETIFLLRGKALKTVIVISEVIIPPSATYGRGFSSFPSTMLPMDFSIVGTVHSHPSGYPQPSIKDLNSSFGRILLIITYPYMKKEDVIAYNSKGKKLELKISEDQVML